MEGCDSSSRPRMDPEPWIPMPACLFRQQLASLAHEYVLLERENLLLREHLSIAGTDSYPVDETDLSTAPCSFDEEASQSYEVELITEPRKLCVEALHSAFPADMDESSWNVGQGCHLVAKSQSDFAAPKRKLKLREQLRDDEDNSFRQVGSMASTVSWWKEANSKKPIFAHADSMKERVRQQLYRQKYNEADHYKTDGCFQSIARHPAFESVSYMVIALNALWIAIDTDYNKEALLINSDAVFQVTEHTFCVYFVAELFIRFMAFENKSKTFTDAWFVFDLLLVLLMVLENWVLTIVILIATTSIDAGDTHLSNTSVLRSARILRITRMARMVRLLRAVPELVILLKGMAAAMRSVFFTLVLLCVLIYVFAIAFTQLLESTSIGEFRSVGRSMHTLWLRFTLLDECVEVVDRVEKESYLCVVLLDLFILAAALTVMNMLVGVLCEVVSAVASSEKEEMSLYSVKAKVERIFHDLGLDEDGNGRISKQEFVKIIENREAARAMQDLGVDVVGLVDMADIFFSASDNDETYAKELSFTEFMDTVVALRGSNNATVKDIMDLRKGLMDKITALERAGNHASGRSSGSGNPGRMSARGGGNNLMSWNPQRPDGSKRSSLPPVSVKKIVNVPPVKKAQSAEGRAFSPVATTESPADSEMTDWKFTTSEPKRQISGEDGEASADSIVPLSADTNGMTLLEVVPVSRDPRDVPGFIKSPEIISGVVTDFDRSGDNEDNERQEEEEPPAAKDAWIS